MIYNLLPIRLLKRLFPRQLWRVSTAEKALFLSFDDGPHPEWTPKVLDLLAAYGAKASFFVVGQQAKMYPALLQRIRQEGHTLGGHTLKHADAWRKSKSAFLEEMLFEDPELQPFYRPPYGHITPSQVKQAKEKGQQIVMWSRLTGDFSSAHSPTAVACEATKAWRRGEIIVFHDSDKAGRNMLLALKYTLQNARAQGFRCKALHEVVG